MFSEIIFVEVLIISVEVKDLFDKILYASSGKTVIKKVMHEHCLERKLIFTFKQLI